MSLHDKARPRPERAADHADQRDRAARLRDISGRFAKRAERPDSQPKEAGKPSQEDLPSAQRPEPHGTVAGPADAAPGSYGLTIIEGGAGLRCPPGSIVIVESLPPTGAGLAVFYRKGKTRPSVIYDITRNFRPDTFAPQADTSTAFPMIEAIEPISGRCGHLDPRDFEKIHRVIAVNIPPEVAAKHRAPPPELPSMSECPAGMSEARVTTAEAYPMVRPGETVIADPSQRDPTEGGLFLLQWNNGHRSVLLTNYRAAGGTNPPAWWVDPVNRPANREMMERRLASNVGMMFTSDGPYDAGHLREKIVGAVVGILAPHGSVSTPLQVITPPAERDA